MNLYVRYFESEVLVHSVEEALDFLYSIPELGMNAKIEEEVRSYYNSDIYYPKRYKIRQKVYFILIKTTAETMEDFKDKKALNPSGSQPSAKNKDLGVSAIVKLNEERPGWYEASMDFKRVMLIPGTGKFEYRDTHVEYRCKAYSGLDCYNRVLDYLHERVDERSQFPSAKGKNFKFKYIGMWK